MPDIQIEPMAVIGLISDTHDHLPPEATQAMQEANVVLHLGDCCDEDVLIRLRAEFDLVHAVRGNNDHALHSLPEKLTIEWGLWRLFAVHIRDRHIHQPFDLPTLGLYGHTHAPLLHPSPSNGSGGGAHAWLNPGAIYRAAESRPSVALLRQHADAIEVNWRFFHKRRNTYTEYDAVIRLDQPPSRIDPLSESFDGE